jgi:hypothetical protein
MLEQLDELKRPSGDPRARSRMEKLLSGLARRRLTDAASLVRFHEILLFVRAYPQSASLVRQAERLLSNFHERVGELEASGAKDLYLLEAPDASGIAGTTLLANFSYDILRDISARHPSQFSVVWEDYGEQWRFASVMSRFLPLVEENVYVETYFPLTEWLLAAQGVRDARRLDLAWILERFERLPLPEKERADLFDSLKLWVRWEFGNSPITRTRMRRRSGALFYHDAPLLTRRDVSLDSEVEAAEPLPFDKLSHTQARTLIDAGRDTMAMRFRELHGFMYADARRVWRAAVGRGVEIFIWGVEPERRLPSLAYHALLIFKNGVPAGYAEALTLFERAEVGLNLYYTFREGESGWIYARLLRLLRQFLGVKVFSVDPYQLGHHNAEGLASGAFWFYRKLGFRPVQKALAARTLAEERKLTARPGYRTSRRILEQLSSGHVLYETPTAERGAWDNFHIRNLGLAVQRRMAARFGGDADKMRRASTRSVARALGLNVERLKDDERQAFTNLSLLLALIPDLSRWPQHDKQQLRRIIRAKAAPDESDYVRLLQNHKRLRREIIRMGDGG